MRLYCCGVYSPAHWILGNKDTERPNIGPLRILYKLLSVVSQVLLPSVFKPYPAHWAHILPYSKFFPLVAITFLYQ